MEWVELTEEAKQLAEMYITEKVVGRTSMADCQHIALATIHKADVLASWNFKHIVNLEQIRGYNSINFNSTLRSFIFSYISGVNLRGFGQIKPGNHEVPVHLVSKPRRVF